MCATQASEMVEIEVRMLANNDDAQDVHYVSASKSHSQKSTHSTSHAHYGYGHKQHENSQVHAVYVH